MSDPRPAFDGPHRRLARGVNLVTTTRRGGLADGPRTTAAMGARDAEAAAVVAANRARLGRLLALPSEPLWLRQVHGTAIVGADGVDPGSRPAADGAWSASSGRVCAVLTADCLPVVIARADGGALAVAHAGWRGLAAGVLEEAVAALDPGPLVAWLGPAIGPARFEVGPEVRDAFLQGDPGARSAIRRGRDDRWLADLYLLARRRLRAAGVHRVHGGGRCTFSDSGRYFSHRRDGPATGRMATLAWLD